MKRISVLLGVLIAVSLTWWSLGGRIEQEPAALGPAAVEVPPSIDEGRALPERSGEASDNVEGAGPGAVELDGRSDPCDELHRRAEVSGVSIGFAEGSEAEADRCATLLRMLFESRVSAIPGFTGFDVRDMGDRSPRALLAAEADRPEWSRPMEGAILQEFTSLLDFPITTLHAVCRSSTCGLLFAYRTADHHGGNYNSYAERLADKLGFSGYHGGHSSGFDGNGFTYIYLGDWNTQRTEDGFESNDAGLVR